MTDVTLPARVAELLIADALGALWGADETTGCCPACCGPCSALKELLDAGRLDDLVREYGRDCFWWDEANDRVDREWLTGAWRMTACHEEDPGCDCNRAGMTPCDVTRGVGDCPCVCHDVQELNEGMSA